MSKKSLFFTKNSYFFLQKKVTFFYKKKLLFFAKKSTSRTLDQTVFNTLVSSHLQNKQIKLLTRDFCCVSFNILIFGAAQKMASRGPRDASSTNCPEFGDQLNGRII